MVISLFLPNRKVLGATAGFHITGCPGQPFLPVGQQKLTPGCPTGQPKVYMPLHLYYRATKMSCRATSVWYWLPDRQPVLKRMWNHVLVLRIASYAFGSCNDNKIYWFTTKIRHTTLCCFECTEFGFDPYGNKQRQNATPNGVIQWSCMRLRLSLNVNERF